MSVTIKESERSRCTLEKDAAEQLRDAIKSNYSTRGGTRNLRGSAIATYEALSKHMDTWLAGKGLVVKYREKAGRDLVVAHAAPGYLKQLFYTMLNDNEEVITGSLFSVDICHLYAYEQTYAERAAQLTAPAKVIVNGIESDRFRVVIAAVSSSGNEADKLRSKLQQLLPGATVVISYRDLSVSRRDSFVDLYGAGETIPIVFWLIGKDYLYHEAGISEICGAQSTSPELLHERTVFMLLDDVCQGDHSLNLTSGRLRVVQFWREQLELVRSLSQPAGPTSAVQSPKPTNSQAGEERVARIVSGMEVLMNYFGDSVRSAPCDHFVNRFGKHDLEQLLDGMTNPQ